MASDAVLGEVREWQSRALERMYPIVIFDALRVKIRDADSRMVKSEPLMRHWFEQRRIVRHWFKNNGARRAANAVYVALGVTRDGLREVLG